MPFFVVNLSFVAPLSHIVSESCDSAKLDCRSYEDGDLQELSFFSLSFLTKVTVVGVMCSYYW
jgi:hypothetical protein